MEIKVNIPTNDYEQPTEIRSEVVQGICDVFLNGGAWSTFHPFSESVYRRASNKIIRHKNDKKFYGFHDEGFSNDIAIRFNGAEMKAAFAALIKAGYHMFKVYNYGTWKGYICSKKPFYKDGIKVSTFDDFID